MLRRTWSVAAAAVLILAGGQAPATGQAGRAGGAGATSMSAFFASRWTYQPSWSPDGRWIAYLQDDWERQTLYVVPAAGGTPRALSRAERFIGNPRTGSSGQPPVWSPDGASLAYVQDGDLKIVSVGDGRILDFTVTREQETDPGFSPDGTWFSYSREGRIHLVDRATGALRQISPPDGFGFGGTMWSPDGARIAVTVGSFRPFTLVPAYLGRLMSFPFGQPGDSDVAVIDATTGSHRVLVRTPLNEAPLTWAPDGRRLLVERVSDDYKTREILLVAVDGSSETTVLQERDDRYLPLGRGFARFHGSDAIVYASDTSGWNHLYRYDLKTNTRAALTEGAFEVREAVLGRDGWAYFTSSETGPAEPHVFRVRVDGGGRQRLTQGRSVHAGVQVDPAGERIVYLRSGPDSLPDVWMQPAAGGPPVRVSDANLPAAVSQGWQEPTLVTYPGHDGFKVHAQLFLPPRREPGRRYPAIVHTHQAASYQDVYAGPGPQKDNVAWYAWHQRLAQRGYVVLNVDYRGSTGYGRHYRVANYRDLGGGDRLDAVSGVEYLKTLGYVDAERVGVYGMSYGGHLVLSLLTRSPDVFRAGIDISGVADMQMVYDTAGRGAVVARLSTPEAEPELYRRSSAITHVAEMKAPVMVLHGTDDPNVSILQSLRLVDELLRHGKRFEFEVYPGELHFFTRGRSWIDAFAKMERFFDAELRAPSVGGGTQP